MITEKRKDQPLVSVIIPCYNLGRYLDEAVGSVQQQSYSNTEIIVVDDGSTDSTTVNIVKRLKTKNKLINVILKKNEGLSEARNTGIRAAKGEYIVCLDADDKLSENYLSETMAVMLDGESDGVGIVTTWLQEFDARSDVWKTQNYNPVRLLTENILHAGSLFKKSIWQETGGYKKEMRGGYEDWEFWMSAVEQGYQWRVVSKPLFLYRIRPDSMLSTMDEKLHQKLYTKLYDFHKDLFHKYERDFALDSSRTTKELHKRIKHLWQSSNTSEERIAAQEQHINELLAELTKVTNDLDQLHLSRVTKPAIELRRLLMGARRRARGAKGRSLSVAKKFTPRPVKQVAKGMRNRIRAKKIIYISNEKWKAGAPLVTIVSPYYNQSASIFETVESVLWQTYTNFEYIIVDDGSRPDESKILDLFEDKRIKVIHLPENVGNGSPAAARNIGIKDARGKYIVCLDSDDMLDETYIEKNLIVLETNPNYHISSTFTRTFGDEDKIMTYPANRPRHLIDDNNLTTASMFTKDAWKATGGYKTGIGYEDWEFWINQAEHGFFGRVFPEPIFEYRVAQGSRYTQDKRVHRDNLKKIKQIHPKFSSIVRKLENKVGKIWYVPTPQTAYINLKQSSDYRQGSKKKKILLALPWMTFGGAETLILNFCREISDVYELSFITGLESKHEWEYKFKELSKAIYHLPNLFERKEQYLDFISNYISTREIDVLHTIHTDFMFEFLPELKKRHPELKIVLTMFNDRVPHYFGPSIDLSQSIDVYVTDNKKTADHYSEVLPAEKLVVRIPNGIDCFNDYDPKLFDRTIERTSLKVKSNELAVFFIGRLSEEKNPNVFLDVARSVVGQYGIDNVKFFVVGDGQMRTFVEEEVASINNDNVVYLGYDAAVAHLLSAADIFVLPSSIEGFPLSILEAMAMKVAVIASDVGAVADVIQDGVDGLIVTPGSREEIIQKIIELNTNRELLDSIKKAARRKLEVSYSNKVLGDNYKKMYKEVLK